MAIQADGHRHNPQLIPRRLLRSGQIHHPAVLEEAKRRSDNFQLRLADRITAFAGSMNFVWLHAALFGVWMLFVEPSPWPTLTLVVSLEAIFLSTFVMIGQNRPGGLPAGQGRPRFSDSGAGAQDQHRAHPPDPCAHRGTAPTGHRGQRLRVKPVQRCEKHWHSE
ncbi:DUF1003 domain-containing protein [Mycobacterium stomatepiae]|uniref:DUF1003 domain-containing protein n=1 Tax=Mycobacterium stomatepiae TaxID=470076 RepID=UPI001E2A6A4C|nr:DUF1003 domain-containing protein [Mycobacterium stomatepiae]